MEPIICKNKCCILSVKLYESDKKNFKHNKHNRKAGIFIYDPDQQKVLIVQSRGHLWGLPKGTVKPQETEKNCAIREVFEETGLIVHANEFSKAAIIRNKAIYFYVERKLCPVEIQEHIVDNDVNALGWIKPDCLDEFINSKQIVLNQHCKIVFKKFLNKSFF